MRHVVFCVPFFREASLRFVKGVAALPDVKLALVTQDPRTALPPDLDRQLAERRIYPAINLGASGTRKEERLLKPDDLDRALHRRQVTA